MAKVNWNAILLESVRPGATTGLVSNVAAPPAPGGGAAESESKIAAVTRENSQTMERLAGQLAALTATARVQASSTEDNTRAVIENSVAVASAGKASKAGSVAKTVLSFLGGGFGLVTLIGSLLGKSSPAAAPAATSYTAPAPVRIDAGLLATQGAARPIYYAQDGLPRAEPAPAAPMVTVQVNAMDSRSFLDHSDEIAEAVKNALLTSHSLTDVVTEL